MLLEIELIRVTDSGCRSAFFFDRG